MTQDNKVLELDGEVVELEMIEVPSSGDTDKSLGEHLQGISTRETKLDEQMVEDAYKLMLTGISPRSIAGALRISDTSFYQWQKKGKRLLEECQEHDRRINAYELLMMKFFVAMREAKAELEKDLLRSVMTEGPKGARWILSRRFRDQWGNSVEVQVNDTKTYQLEFPTMEKE